MIGTSEFRVSLPYRAAGFLDCGGALTASTDELESTYADDIMYGVLHPVAAFIVQALAFSVWALHQAAEHNGLV